MQWGVFGFFFLGMPWSPVGVWRFGAIIIVIFGRNALGGVEFIDGAMCTGVRKCGSNQSHAATAVAKAGLGLVGDLEIFSKVKLRWFCGRLVLGLDLGQGEGYR
jgi:hypothetical protein